MPDKTQKELIHEIHDVTLLLKTVLLGVPDTENGGLVSEVKDLSKSHYTLKKSFWILIGVLVGSGILGAGVYNLLGG